MPSTDLQTHIRATYFMLRKGLAALAFALPLVLWIGGRIFGGLPLQQSMSAYYHSGNGVMRDAFVGIVRSAVSFFLILYKGFTYFENWAFNLAGGFLSARARPHGVGLRRCLQQVFRSWHILFALFPVHRLCVHLPGGRYPGPHEGRGRGEPLSRASTRLIGGAMIGAPVIAAIVSFVLNLEGSESDPRSTLFYIEATCIYVFMAYWIVKSIEIARTNSDKLAMEGKLTLQYQPGDIFKKLSVKRVSQQVGRAEVCK